MKVMKSYESKECYEEFLCLQGGEEALKAIVRRFGKAVLDEAPKIKELVEAASSVGQPQAILQSLECLRVAGPVMEPELNPYLESWLPQILAFLGSEDSTIRVAAARSAVAIVKSRPEVLMNTFMR